MATVACALEAGTALGEGAIWDEAEAALYFVDIEGGMVHRFDPARGDHTTLPVGERVGCIALRTGGGAVAATESGIYTLDLAKGAKTLVAAPEADLPDNRFNDGAVDPEGRWWVGSMSMAKPQPATGAFWRLDADHTLTKWQDGFTTTNGLAFAPDGKTMYFADSAKDVRTVFRADYDLATGTPSNPKPFFDTREVRGRPDGAAVDEDGCYWMAGVGGWELVRLTPSGAVDMRIDLPVERPSRPAFGGPDLSTLYVTTIAIGTTPGTEQPLAGALLAVTGLPAKGHPVPRFAG
ncbi:MAG: SMP-30/gluconolactonase/LRE family protein [Pseudomonadota bacterium]